MEKIKEAVIRACSNFDCIYALLFGSVARGDVRDYSDVDIAVKFRDSRNCHEKTLDLMSETEGDLGVHVDVVPLNIADTIIKYEAYSQGILLFSMNNNEYIDDFINAINEYLDFESMLNRFYKLIVKEIRDACTRVKSRIERFWRAMKRLQEISSVSVEEFMKNEDLRDACERNLQVAVEATIDVGEALITYMKWRTPKSYKEIVTILLENGIIDGMLSEKFKDAINMRNILVYNYIYIEPGELYSNTRNLIHPLNRIKNYIINYIQEKNINP